MKYICEIYKNTENSIFLVMGGIRCILLPIFELVLQPTWVSPGYVLYFKNKVLDEAYSIYLQPPYQLTDEQRKIINEKWNYCVENNLYEYKFEL